MEDVKERKQRKWDLASSFIGFRLPDLGMVMRLLSKMEELNKTQQNTTRKGTAMDLYQTSLLKSNTGSKSKAQPFRVLTSTVRSSLQLLPEEDQSANKRMVDLTADC